MKYFFSHLSYLYFCRTVVSGWASISLGLEFFVLSLLNICMLSGGLCPGTVEVSFPFMRLVFLAKGSISSFQQRVRCSAVSSGSCNLEFQHFLWFVDHIAFLFSGLFSPTLIRSLCLRLLDMWSF